jgi:subtilisin family serine protease
MRNEKIPLTLTLLAISLISVAMPTQAITTMPQRSGPKFTFNVPSSSSSSISLLIESEHNLKPEEIWLLSNFGKVTTVAGPIAVLRTQSTELNDLARLPFVSHISRSHPLSLYLDKSVPDTGANTVWNEVKDPNGRNVTGAGVIIGFVDTGIDITHPDFSFPNGTTKILFVWDQTTQGRPPNGFDYGFECTSEDIQDQLCPEVDTFGHGTHVAGIAASSGMATGKYVGVAPGASIIFVKSGNELCNGTSWTFSTAQILDGINYIVKKAAQLGRRAVINLSLGGNIGAHDGTDPLELGLDAIVNDGTPIVVAAGNARQDKDHVQGQLLSSAPATLKLTVQPSTTDLAVDIWYPPQDQMDATMNTPDGQVYSIPTPPGGAVSTYGNLTAIASPSEHGNELYFEVNSTAELPANGWSITLKTDQIISPGVWDAWVDTNSCSYPGASFVQNAGYDIDPYGTVGIPGTAEYVVTVGAYISKTSWLGMNNQTFGSPSVSPGGIAPFSSLGPTRDGRIKPDVAAPGMLIASARSTKVAERSTDPDPYHRILAGTSMATPHVAGVVALMLQYEPDIVATDIPRILRETARVDSRTGLLPSGSPTWGFGKVDARTATGLFRLTLVPNVIPKNVNIPIRIDDSVALNITSDSWSNLYFLKGTTHAVSLDSELRFGTGRRYELGSVQLLVSATSLKQLNYTVQYLLTVNSKYGPTTGSGWYDQNATARFDAPKSTMAPGLLGYLGVEYTLAFWATEDGKIVSNPVIMDSPKTVTAVYLTTYSIQTIITAISAAVVVLLVVLAWILVRRRRT